MDRCRTARTHTPRLKLSGRVIRNFQQGAFCPAEMWSQFASIATASSLGVRAVLKSLAPAFRQTLLDAYRERSESLSILEDQPDVLRVLATWYEDRTAEAPDRPESEP